MRRVLRRGCGGGGLACRRTDNAAALPLRRCSSDWSHVAASRSSMRVSNPIRDIVDQLDLDNINKSKPLIPLSIGDPTKFGNLDTDRTISAALLGSVHSSMYNGYPPSDGYVESRQAVAERYSSAANPLVADDVSLTSGCSQ